MKFQLDEHIKLDQETNQYVMDKEQVVRDNVEKDHWKIVLRTILKDWRLYLMLVPMLFIFICWRYLPMYELLTAFKSNLNGFFASGGHLSHFYQPWAAGFLAGLRLAHDAA